MKIKDMMGITVGANMLGVTLGAIGNNMPREAVPVTQSLVTVGFLGHTAKKVKDNNFKW